MTASVHCAKLSAITWICTLVKDKTANIYTDTRNALGVVQDFFFFPHDF